jgi:hypothetical protein
MSIGKNDSAAREHWGAAYNDIPKSVFAVAAWHLANVASGHCDAAGAAEKRMIEEIEALAANGIMDAAQAKRALKILKEAI